MHKYENHTALEINQVYGENIVYVAIEDNASPVPMKHPAFDEIFSLGIGLFFVLTIIPSYFASLTWPKH
jgi:hypothetical protein